MKEITVTIPPQTFDNGKYCGTERCYLEDALDKMGLTNSQVGGMGHAVIDKVAYVPTLPFNRNILQANFTLGIPTTIILKPIKPIINI